MLASLGRTKSEERFRTEVAWRDFYADVLWHKPESARRSLRPAMERMAVDTGDLADERFTAWGAGRTGYPLVDAGMRQLAGEAWVHNRVRSRWLPELAGVDAPGIHEPWKLAGCRSPGSSTRPPSVTPWSASTRSGHVSVGPGLPKRDQNPGTCPQRSRTRDNGSVDDENSDETEHISVLVADDEELFRRGLRTVLELETGFTVAEAGDGAEAVERATVLAPDVVLMDVRMPNMGGIEAARRIREVAPTSRVIMLTSSDDDDDLFGAVRAGANGYLLKDSSLEDVAHAVRTVAAGGSLIGPPMATRLLVEFTALADGRPNDPGATLSERELDVLRLVAQGRTNRETAKELNLSENTVKNHMANILDKLHLRSRVEAAVYAMRTKLF